MKKVSFYLAVGILTMLASCTKKDTTPASTTSTTPTPTAVTISSTPQFTGTINGTNYSLVNGTTYSNGVSSSRNTGGSGATSNSATYSSYIVNAANSGITINKGTITYALTSTYPDSATYKAFFAPGKYSYSVNYTNGIEVDWTDANGVTWSTSTGTGTQTGSTFTIVAEQYANDLGYQDEKVLINFTCTLYNSSGGSMKLTNGVFVGYFENS